MATPHFEYLVHVRTSVPSSCPPGHSEVEVFPDQDNPDIVFLWEKWASWKDQEAYLAWRIETGTLDEMSRYGSVRAS